MSDLKDDLTDIDGVGEVTADRILETLEAHDSTDSEVAENVREAYKCYAAGEVGYARKFIERAYEAL